MGTFTFKTMQKVMALAKRETNVSVAFDWAGSYNTYPNDQPLWDKIKEASSLEAKAGFIKRTQWFAAYSGQVKGAAMTACQDGYVALLVCIAGGDISQVEAKEMPTIRQQIIEDLIEKLQFRPTIKCCNVGSYQELEALTEKIRPRLQLPALRRQVTPTGAKFEHPQTGESFRPKKHSCPLARLPEHNADLCCGSGAVQWYHAGGCSGKIYMSAACKCYCVSCEHTWNFLDSAYNCGVSVLCEFID
jgi:hypothetical protein